MKILAVIHKKVFSVLFVSVSRSGQAASFFVFSIGCVTTDCIVAFSIFANASTWPQSINNHRETSKNASFDLSNLPTGL